MGKLRSAEENVKKPGKKLHLLSPSFKTREEGLSKPSVLREPNLRIKTGDPPPLGEGKKSGDACVLCIYFR